MFLLQAGATVLQVASLLDYPVLASPIPPNWQAGAHSLQVANVSDSRASDSKSQYLASWDLWIPSCSFYLLLSVQAGTFSFQVVSDFFLPTHLSLWCLFIAYPVPFPPRLARGVDPSGVDWPWVQMEGGGSHPTHATQSKIPNTSRAVGRAYTRVGQHAHLSFIPFPPFQIVRVGLWEGPGAK